jgi:hypothetical protein
VLFMAFLFKRREMLDIQRADFGELSMKVLPGDSTMHWPGLSLMLFA